MGDKMMDDGTIKKILADCATEEEVKSVIARKKEEYEDAPEPKMRKDIFYALMETYEKYHQAFKNLKDR